VSFPPTLKQLVLFISRWWLHHRLHTGDGRKLANYWLGRIWKEAAVANRKPQKKSWQSVSRVRLELATSHTRLQHHHYTNQPGRQGQVMSKDNQRRDFIVVPGKTRRPSTRNKPVCHDRPNLMFLWPCIMNWPYKTTNVMHWILFIRQILLLSSTCFEYQVLIYSCISTRH